MGTPDRLLGSRRRLAGLGAALLAALLVPAAAALADPAPAGVFGVSPNAAGHQSHLLINADGAPAGLQPHMIPSALSIDFQRGFAFDPLAVAVLCTSAEASGGKCPAASQIAHGTIHVQGAGALAGQSFTATTAFYEMAPQMAGDIAGVDFHFVEPSSGFSGDSVGRVVTLASDPVYGAEIVFSHLPIPTLPPGLDLTLTNLTLDLGGGGPGAKGRKHHKKHGRHRQHRRHKKRKQGRRRGAGHAVAAQASHALLTNPTTCASSWSIRMTLVYSSGPQERDGPVPCTP